MPSSTLTPLAEYRLPMPTQNSKSVAATSPQLIYVSSLRSIAM